MKEGPMLSPRVFSQYPILNLQIGQARSVFLSLKSLPTFQVLALIPLITRGALLFCFICENLNKLHLTPRVPSVWDHSPRFLFKLLLPRWSVLDIYSLVLSSICCHEIKMELEAIRIQYNLQKKKKKKLLEKTLSFLGLLRFQGSYLAEKLYVKRGITL